MELACQSFSTDIEEMIRKGATTLDAVIRWCEDRQVEIEVGAELVGQYPVLKSRLELESEALKLLKRTDDRLPI